MKISCFSAIITKKWGDIMLKKYNLKLYQNSKLIQEDIIKAITNNNKISFIHKDVKNTIDNDTYIRENKEYKFLIDLINKKSSYLLKNNNILYDIEVYASSIEKNEKKIIIKYNIETIEQSIKIILERCE